MPAAAWGGLAVFGFFVLLWIASIEIRLRRHAVILGPISSLLQLAGMILKTRTSDSPKKERNADVPEV